MHQVDVSLSHHQIQKAARGHPIQLHAKQLHGAHHKLVLHPENAKKYHRAKRQRKGVRLHLSPEEIHASGLMDWLKKGFEFVKEKVVPTVQKIYEPLKPILAPIIRQGTEQLVQKGISKVGAKNKFLGDVASQLAPSAIEALGSKTGAFGLRKHMIHGSGTGTMSPILSPLHPAMMTPRSRPPAPSVPPVGGFGVRKPTGRGGRRGGSFMAV